MAMGRASAATLLVALAVLALAVMAQATCDDELPAQLAGNFSGLACAPVWNNFVLRVCSTSRHCYDPRDSCLLALDPWRSGAAGAGRALPLCPH
jgi:hypothetical protein